MSVKLREYFANKIENDEKNTNNEMCRKYFGYQGPSFLTKDLNKVNHRKNERIANKVNDALIDLKNDINKKTFPENENPDKVIDIAEESFDFSYHQKGKKLEVLTPKQIIQRLASILNEIRQIIYYLHR